MAKTTLKTEKVPKFTKTLPNVWALNNKKTFRQSAKETSYASAIDQHFERKRILHGDQRYNQVDIYDAK